ncbi:DEK, C-terminal [Dillenia turbinata]|uniref:DEK, C-terminal n=1 Tax=Dillenia turbinata TaxID=194707 RepID=A0AAN8Z458_9MAGN
MVTDSELVHRLREFLKTSDLNTTTTAIVRKRLEEEFGVDLTEKKAFIREQVDLFLQSQLEKAQEEEEEEAVEDGEEKVRAEESEGSIENEEGEEESDEQSSNGKASRKGRSSKQKKEVKKRGGGGGFTKLCSLSPQLQKFVGVPEAARTEVVKQLWAYIREKELQDPSNKKNIICDDALYAIFGVKSIDMFQMNKALTKHIWPLESEDAPAVKSTPKQKQQKQEKEDSDEPKRKEKRPKEESSDSDEPKQKEKRKKGGFLAPIGLSNALVKFLGTGESALPRSDVVKRIWDYIKKHGLQDPSDKRQVICDDKLRELFDVESFHGFTVSKLLSTHFIKAEQ